MPLVVLQGMLAEVRLNRREDRLKGARLLLGTGEFVNLRIPRALGGPLLGELETGCTVRAWALKRKRRLKALLVLPMQPRPEARPTPVRVDICTHKHCLKRGAAALVEQARRDLPPDRFRVRCVDCLGHCGKGPNLRLVPGGEELHRVRPEQLAERLGLRPCALAAGTRLQLPAE